MPEGRQRIRKANLRHGFYSKDKEAALHALGEDPEEFLELLEGFRSEKSATTALKKRLREGLARAFWRMKRAHRMQEGQSPATHTTIVSRQFLDALTGRELE